MIQKGKATLPAGQDSLQINFSKSFDSIPVVNISCKESVNVYLNNITVSYIIVNISSSISSDLEIHYVALGK
tara:strand:- start:162 stop:377 length:216 start_codon:yes stop_codon:yes gene_type:complete